MEESEYIYKTFDRGDGDFVTLLEENRDIIGHGTTGLTSWQGALFMADWIKANSSVVEVRPMKCQYESYSVFHTLLGYCTLQFKHVNLVVKCLTLKKIFSYKVSAFCEDYF